MIEVMAGGFFELAPEFKVSDAGAALSPVFPEPRATDTVTLADGCCDSAMPFVPATARNGTPVAPTGSIATRW